ncbi:MAG: hypothetical protein F6K37_36375 [Moorea sp. SIO4E2]|uniref:hypothetical protein n=1 Tax=Moorena sp. SIO4E2 TaxID=2607826 RepID=UPI0013B60C2F|nr:hypothetical protein [Moorena sp. SIO4E2]NEQ11185.1 hypothetical protein [Moorena sp. SIO4E2]
MGCKSTVPHHWLYLYKGPNPPILPDISAIAFVGWAKVDDNCTFGETIIICPPYT